MSNQIANRGWHHRLGKHARVASTLVELSVGCAARYPPPPIRNRMIGEWLTRRLPTLGPTYVKIGQFIATRSDVYGEDLTTPMKALCHSVPPLSGEDLRALVERNVDASQLASFEYNPIAVGSIAQVHRATLTDGRDVIVKLLRDDINESIRSDVAFLFGVIDKLQAMNPKNDMIEKTRNILVDIHTQLEEETDFARESDNLDRMYRLYIGQNESDDYRVRIPRLVRRVSTPRALVMENVPCVHLNQLGSVAMTGQSRKRLSAALMTTFIDQMMTGHLLHGDPHYGNIGVCNIGDRPVLVLYDFGNVIQLTEKDVNLLKELLLYLLFNNVEEVIRVLESMGAIILDRRMLVDILVGYRLYMKHMDIQKLIDVGLQTNSSQSVPVILPTLVSRILRSFTLLEGVCKNVDPEFNYFSVMLQVVSKSTKSFMSPAFMEHKAFTDIGHITNVRRQFGIDME